MTGSRTRVVRLIAQRLRHYTNAELLPEDHFDRLGYQLWQQLLKLASTVYERGISRASSENSETEKE